MGIEPVPGRSVRSGVSRRDYPTQDSLPAAEVTLSSARIPADFVRWAKRRSAPRYRVRGGRSHRRALRRGGRHLQGMHELTLE
jgi:hypothetical protein